MAGFFRDDTNRTDTMLTACQQQSHSVIGIQFPVFCRDIQHPSFRNKSFKKKKQSFLFVKPACHRQGECQKLFGVQFHIIIRVLKSILAAIRSVRWPAKSFL